MSIETIKNQLPDYAKDIKLNLSSVLTPDGAPDLTLKQIYLIALASAYACKNQRLVQALSSDAGNPLSDPEKVAANSASVIMAMTNVYYRFIHLVDDHRFSSLPARLRMNVMANPGIDKQDFELASLAVSAINGCGMCMTSHTKELEKAGSTVHAIQSAVRIAAVIHASSLALSN